MDVNLRRLPQNIDCISKFLESLADIMLVSVADEQSEVSGQSNRKDKTAESKKMSERSRRILLKRKSNG